MEAAVVTEAAVESAQNGREYAAVVHRLATRLLSLATLDARGEPVWSGDDVDPIRSSGQHAVLTYGQLDDGLLTGRVGVAVALAAASRVPGGQSSWSATAQKATWAAVRSAVGRPRPTPGACGWSSGWLGIARGAGLVAEWTGDLSLGEAARDLNGRAIEALHRDRDCWPDYPDLLDGLAGHLVAVLAADLEPTREGMRRDVAARLLRRLLEFSDAADHGRGLERPTLTDPLAWPMAGTEPPVIGLAHGGSGIALALAASAAADIGDPDQLVLLIARTRLWEDQHFRAAAGGWPDLRATAEVPGLAWCHGAPGVGIAAAYRARLGAADAADDAEATYRRARAVVQTYGTPHGDTPFDGTLCHGLSGLIELHLAGAETWPAAAEEHLRAARILARHLTRAGRPGHPGWVCGVPGGRTPMLLTGLAGVAYTLVRCHDPSLAPSLTHPGLPARALAATTL